MKNCRLLALLVFLNVSMTASAERVVEVIPVNNRPASEIQPLLMPLLEDTDQVVDGGDSLIVKTTPERLGAITNLIRKLDNPLNNLIISVIQSRDVTADQMNAGVNVDLQVLLQQPGHPQGGIEGYYGQSQNYRNNQNTQTIRALEGQPAHIRAGNVVPITNQQIYQDPYGYQYGSRSTQLVETTTGFEVTPRLAGQQVILDVSPWSDRFGQYGQIETQGANTTIRANLGEWVEIGGVDESSQSSGYNTFGYNREYGQSNLRILVKVDRAK